MLHFILIACFDHSKAYFNEETGDYNAPLTVQAHYICLKSVTYFNFSDLVNEWLVNLALVAKI